MRGKYYSKGKFSAESLLLFVDRPHFVGHFLCLYSGCAAGSGRCCVELSKLTEHLHSDDLRPIDSAAMENVRSVLLLIIRLDIIPPQIWRCLNTFPTVYYRNRAK